MSLVVDSREIANHQLVRYSESEPVPLPGVQDMLSALWRLASEQVQEEGDAALARACLWNLVAFHSNPKLPRGNSAGEAMRIETLLQDVSASVPARVIHLEEWRNEAAPEPGKEVEAWVTTHCLHTGTGPHLLCCEQINLAGYGERGHSHFPALVRALLVPDIPVGLLWLDNVPRRGRLLGQLLQMADRMIIDSQRAQDTDSLLAVNDLQRASPGKVADLGWLRLNPLRHLIADFFDPPGRAEQLATLDRILMEISPEGRTTGYLLLGWLLSRCGYHDVQAVDLGDRKDAFRWHVKRADGKLFPLDIQVSDGDGGLDGIFCIQLEAGGDTFALRDVDPEHMSVAGPDRSLPSVPLREATEPELVADALGAGLHNGVYAEALAMAAVLAETEQWTQ
ncbi:MAG TPA: glucose-6-phosphate dehydrogenase assembly protein OpcA [bacterium]|nr:glucose-6-phosphate dehydrogenase assembly protein OpcA [bacterium]